MRMRQVAAVMALSGCATKSPSAPLARPTATAATAATVAATVTTASTAATMTASAAATAQASSSVAAPSPWRDYVEAQLGRIRKHESFTSLAHGLGGSVDDG